MTGLHMPETRRLQRVIATRLPDGWLVEIADCAAFAPVDQPEALAALIDGHLAA